MLPAREFRVWIWSTLLVLGGLVGALTGSTVYAAPGKSPAHDNVVISEFRTRGPNGITDEFIEIFNPTNSPIVISNWMIKNSTNAGEVGTIITFPNIFPDGSELQLQPGQHFLVANSDWSGIGGIVPPDGTYPNTIDIPDDGGIALTLPDETPVDRVGMSNGSAFQEGTILSPMTENLDQSYERRPGGASGNCTDTNNNDPDFKPITFSDPQNSSSLPTTICIGKGDQTITFNSLPDNPVVDGAPYTPTAIATSSLTVDLTIDATAASVCSISEGEVSFHATGTCVIDANQAGDDNWNPAPPVQQSFPVGKGVQTITVTTHTPTYAAYNSGFTVAATGGASGNPIVYSASGVCTNNLADFTMTSGTGTCIVHYNQAGDANYDAAAEVPESTTATKLAQDITVNTHAPVSAAYKSSFTVAATSDSGLTVTYSGTSGVCTSILGAFTMTRGTGTCIVHYNQAGDANYDAASEVTESVSAAKLDQAITFTSIPPSNAVVGGATYTPIAAATSHLTVHFTIDTTASSVCSISAGVVSFLAVGTCVIDANQPGNANYNPAPQVQQSFNVGIGDQTITFTSTPPSNAVVGGATYTPIATATSHLTVHFTIDTTASSVCSISAGVVSFHAVGTCVIDANQPGNTNYNPAPQVQQSFHVGEGASTPTLSPTATPTAPSHMVISEFRSRGPNGAGDEFVELYNPTGAAVNVGLWMIRRSYSCGFSSLNLVTIPANTILLPGQHYLVAATGSSVTNPDQTFTADIADDGGVGLLTYYAVIVDAAGMCETTQYHEGTALLPLAGETDQSYERKVGGTTSCYDTSDNARDFAINSPAIPQNKASPLFMCPGVFPSTPTSTPTLSPTRTPTRAPTPYPGTVAINEFLPHPHSDWNGDGTANSGDEYIELINMGTEPVNLRNWELDDDGGSNPYTLPSVTLLPRQIAVFYQTETGISLSDGGDSVILVKPDNRTADIYTYPVVSEANRTWCRLPDGNGAWSFICTPSPGKPNTPIKYGKPGTGAEEDTGVLCVANKAPQAVLSAECNSPGAKMWGEARNGEIWLKNRWKWDVFVE